MSTETEPSPIEHPDWSRWRSGPAPAFLLDVGRGLLLDINEAGRAFWWEEDQPAALPIALDRAMPALGVLRAGRGEQQGNGELVFWTQVGAALLACKWQHLPADEPSVVCVVAHAEGPEPWRRAQASPAGAEGAAPLTAKLAHELRTPLGAVCAYADVLAQEHFGPLSNPRYRDYARSIRDSAQHALGVLDRMTASGSADAESRQKELRFRDLDPAGIVESCVAVMRPLASRAGVLLGVAFPAHLPRIVADEVTVRQMLLNLLTNAVKFARPGDRVTLAVTLEDDGGLTFAVEDTGPGLGAADATARSAKGLGIGLPLTRQLAEANGALFALESAPGVGTRASISFGKGRVVPV